MRVAIIGTGSVGTSLARGLDSAGHQLVVGSRTPPDATVGGVPVVDHDAAIADAEATILAVPPAAAVDFAADHAEALAGTAVIDPTNEYPDPASDPSVAERIAAAAPNASVAKAFNTIGAEHLSDPAVGEGTATMFVAGTVTAREAATRLASDLGFDVISVGDVAAADHLENLGRLWIDLSIEHGRNVAYHVLRG